jgi:uncharacterized protein
MTVLALALAAALAADAPPDERARRWEGAWTSPDPKVHATLAIADVSPAGFALEWDEGVGDQGVRAKGRAGWMAGGRARFASAGCTLTLALGPDDRLTATIAPESCFNWASLRTVAFARAGADTPAADCTKVEAPLARAICADPDLAAAERKLAAVQREKLGRHGGGIAATERRYLERRDARCGEEKAPRDCLLREYGRRLLELRAWPAPPFDPATGRPELGVLEAILRDDAARSGSGINELVAGLVGGAPDAIALAPNQDEEGVSFSGCDRTAAAEAPAAGGACAKQHYVGFFRNGETWAAWADAKTITIAPAPEKDQALPASLHAFARGQEKRDPPP